MTRTGHNAMYGFSMLELLISVALGLIVVAAITTLTVRSLHSSTELASMTRLEQELRGILQVMTRDLRRAGFMNYDGLANFIADGENYANPFQTFASTADASSIVRCVSYSYDRDDNGTLTEDAPAAGLPQETFGFRFDAANNAIESLSAPVDPTPAGGGANPNCTSGTWQDISDTSRVEVTDLRFIVPPITTVTIENTAITTGGTDATISQRQLLIQITGRLSDDNSVTRTLNDSVKIRNNEFTPPT